MSKQAHSHNTSSWLTVYIRSLVPSAQLLAQSLAKGDERELGCGIVCKESNRNKARHGSDFDDVTFIALDHVRNKSLARVPMADQVDFKKLLDFVWWRFKYGRLVSDACIVDEDRDWS